MEFIIDFSFHHGVTGKKHTVSGFKLNSRSKAEAIKELKVLYINPDITSITEGK